MVDSLPRAVLDWRDRGRTISWRGHEIFLSEAGSGSPVLYLHGFPGSSFDWREVIGRVAAERRCVSFDFLGYGLSGKPFDQAFSLFEQADLAIAVAEAAGIERCTLAAHDMGDTVTAELLCRQNAGELPFAIDEVFLTNGSIFIDMAGLTDGQKLMLSLPDEPLPEVLPAELLAASLTETFPPGQAPADEIASMVALLRHQEGDRLLPRLIRYVEERRANQTRWTAGFVDFPGPLTALWGELDTIAVPEMARRLAELRPRTIVQIWPDTGHWPSIEAPDQVVQALKKQPFGCP